MFVTALAQWTCFGLPKTLVQAGIREVVYLDDKYADTVGNAISKSVLDRCGVAYRQINLRKEALD